MTKRPVRGSATKQDTGKSCPFCRFPIKERDEVVACGECHSPHHDDCWEEHGGCAVPGCAGGPVGEAGAGGGSGSHLPPVAGPSRKKVTLDPRPAMRRRKRDRSRKKTGTAANAAADPTRSSNVQFWLAAAVIAFIVILGVILISSQFGDRDPVNAASCEPGTGVEGKRCYNNGKLPNRPDDQLQRQIGSFVKGWYGAITNFDFDSAWNDLWPRVRKQINARGGRSHWEENMEGMARHLDPRRAVVTLEKKIYPKDGVQTVNVQNMPYRKSSDRCQERVGVTWVAWDPRNKRWWYEPGLGVTSERAADWKYQRVRVLTPKCN